MKKLIGFVFALALIGLIVPIVAAGDFFGIKFGEDRIKGSGEIVTEERDVRDFDKIKSSGSFDVFIVVGEEQSIEISYDDNLIDLITTKVKGKTLYISSEGSFSSRKSCKIEINVPSLEAVKLSGSGDIEVSNLDAEFFEYSLSGSGDLIASGKVDELEVHVSGSGDIDTRDLMANIVQASISGSGDIKVYAKERLRGKVSGSGDIEYYGDPDKVSSSVSGSGDIRKR